MFAGTLFHRAVRRVKRLITQTALTRAIPRSTRRLIVFLSPGHVFRAGGVMAIGLMYQESRDFYQAQDASVVMCVTPGDPPLLKYDWFKNKNYLLDLDAVLRRCKSLEYLLLHIPEYQVKQTSQWLASAPDMLKNLRELHLNVMAFNIDLIDSQDIRGLSRFGKVTCTTARDGYSTADVRRSIGVPLHALSICTGPEFYSPTEYKDKEPLMVVSAEEHSCRQPVLRALNENLPNLKIQVIQDLSYEDYKSLIRRAKWALTFGEGLDGYFSEPIFSGSIAFAVFNHNYFTSRFAQLENVYKSWEELLGNIVTDIRRLDEQSAYTNCWERAYDVLADELDTNRFRENVRAFYRGEYTFP